MATDTSSARPLVVVLLIVFFLLTGFMLVVAMQRSTEGRSRAAFPSDSLVVPKGRCGIGGESSVNGCCKGFAPSGGICIRIQLREKSN